MSDSLWVLEYRTRERKNGKWSEWSSMDHPSHPVTAFREYPEDQILTYDKYEKKAVEYVRVEKGLSE